MSGSVAREGDHIVTRLPVEEAHGFRIALQPCPCKAARSTSTSDIRVRMDRAIAKALYAKPQPERA